MGDACSLVDAFRAGTISPTEALEGSLAAMADSQLNAVCFVDEERAREAAANADVDLPFGGVPIGMKELDPVEGLAPDGGVARLQGPDLGLRRHHDGPPPGSRRGAGGPDDRVGVRRHQLHLHPPARGDLEPLRPRADSGRLVRRLRGVGGRRPPPAYARAATVAVPSGSRPASPACSASRRPSDASRRDRRPRSSRSPRSSGASRARCATRPGGSTPATATTSSIRSRCPGSRAGRPASGSRRCEVGASRCRSIWVRRLSRQPYGRGSRRRRTC